MGRPGFPSETLKRVSETGVTRVIFILLALSVILRSNQGRYNYECREVCYIAHELVFCMRMFVIISKSGESQYKIDTICH